MTTPVTIDEVIEALNDACKMATDAHGGYCLTTYEILAERIKAYGVVPPSIDALIAEIESVERWFYDDGSGPYLANTKDGGEYYFISDIDTILDKYRSMK